MDKFNSEGYVDRTAQSALARVEAEERKNAWPVVYVCSAYRGNERVQPVFQGNFRLGRLQDKVAAV